MKRVILFGAGASYGSIDAQPDRPPLGSSLFDELRRAYPNVWGSIPETAASKFVPDFEAGMGEIWRSGAHAAPVLIRAMGHYFTRFRPGPDNSYTTLIRGLLRSGTFAHTVFSSLNYDCLLEYAARAAGVERIEYFTEGTSTPTAMTLWKIHGSCNFLTTAVSAGASAISYGSGVTFDGDIQAVDAAVAARYLEQSAVTPSLAVFMEGKPVQTSPTLIRVLQERWETAVRKAEVVGLVGVRPHPVDAHIWKPLAETGARLVVVGDTKAYETWAGSTANRDVHVLGGRFGECVDDLIRALS